MIANAIMDLQIDFSNDGLLQPSRLISTLLTKSLVFTVAKLKVMANQLPVLQTLVHPTTQLMRPRLPSRFSRCNGSLRYLLINF